jgi:hypothetical protein
MMSCEVVTGTCTHSYTQSLLCPRPSGNGEASTFPLTPSFCHWHSPGLPATRALLSNTLLQALVTEDLPFVLTLLPGCIQLCGTFATGEDEGEWRLCSPWLELINPLWGHKINRGPPCLAAILGTGIGPVLHFYIGLLHRLSNQTDHHCTREKVITL